MRIAEVHDPDAVKGIVPIIKSAWGFENLDGLIKDIVVAMKFHGGVVIGAYDEDKLIGMSFGFPGRRKNYDYFYSHMTGVLEERKYSGIGYQLKMYQKAWAKRQGYNMIAWTYDPLMALNARFNIHKIGAFARTYLRNFYGQMDDKINVGMRTDRFVAELWLDYQRPEIEDNGITALDRTGIVSEDMQRIAREESTVRVHIPGNFKAIRNNSMEEAMRWRESSDKVMKFLFSHGFVAVDFKSGTDNFYLFTRDTFLNGMMKENVFQP
ncbi:MAG: hypothetical protein QW597_06185 [Thermoplasmataceae archaeon]